MASAIRMRGSTAFNGVPWTPRALAHRDHVGRQGEPLLLFFAPAVLVVGD